MTLPYELGEMKSENGEVLRVEVEVAASDLAIKMAKIIEKYPVYQEIMEKTGSPKTSLCFQTAIKNEIYPLVKDLHVRKWYRRNNVQVPDGEGAVSAPPTGICRLLDQVWPDRDIPIRFTAVPLKDRLNLRYRSFRSFARRAVDHVSAFYCHWKYRCFDKDYSEGKGTIAVQYVEGVDLQRRSDLVWYPESGIDPARVLVYFAWPDHQPVDATVIQSIEKMGMKYVSLNIHSAESRNVPVWYPSSDGEKDIGSLTLRPACKVEKWIQGVGRKLINEINYWSAFYRAFNIKLHLIVGSKELKYIAQGIAFERHGQGGLMLGKERSELQWPPTAILGWFPVDVYFTWSPRAVHYLRPNVNRIITSVATGYPNDVVFHEKKSEGKKWQDTLRSQGVDFTISLFDNVHGPNMGYSTANMGKFYLAFLSWLLEDPTIGLLIKSKKQAVLKSLPHVLPVLERAEATGRCIRLDDEFGRLPVDASFASDISVGVGISSAVIESAIAGCRSVHCDLMLLRSHEFYQWGHERIIFDDLERLIAALKGHKAGNADFADLGDWTSFFDRLDPFRDGRAGERMGDYMRWCLDAFDEGLDRDAVVSYANGKYKTQWGAVMAEIV